MRASLIGILRLIIFAIPGTLIGFIVKSYLGNEAHGLIIGSFGVILGFIDVYHYYAQKELDDIPNQYLDAPRRKELASELNETGMHLTINYWLGMFSFGSCIILGVITKYASSPTVQSSSLICGYALLIAGFLTYVSIYRERQAIRRLNKALHEFIRQEEERATDLHGLLNQNNHVTHNHS